MKIRTFSATLLTAALVVASITVQVFPQNKHSNAVGDVLFTFADQARFNPATQVLSQFGYLTYVNGVSEVEPIFNPGFRTKPRRYLHSTATPASSSG